MRQPGERPSQGGGLLQPERSIGIRGAHQRAIPSLIRADAEAPLNCANGKRGRLIRPSDRRTSELRPSGANLLTESRLHAGSRYFNRKIPLFEPKAGLLMAAMLLRALKPRNSICCCKWCQGGWTLHTRHSPPLRGGTYVIRSHRDCLAIHRHMARQMTRSRISSSR